MDTVIVTTVKELKEAVKHKRERIVVQGKLADKLQPLSKLKRTPNVNVNMNKQELVGTMAAGSAVASAVWITLIITMGVVIIVGLIRGYDVKLKDKERELVFDRKK